MIEIISAISNSVIMFLRSFEAQRKKKKVQKVQKKKIINEIDLS
jgi:hypothetical protein